MNTYISETIAASVIKFADFMSYGSTQLEHVLEIGHAQHNWKKKLKKTLKKE